jgi:hypothetical protein
LDDFGGEAVPVREWLFCHALFVSMG